MRTQMLELFAAEGKVSKVFKAAGVSTVAYDINHARPGSRAMDFLSEGGFAPGSQLDRLVALWLRLAMICVLQEGPNSLNVLAPDCGSWSSVSRGTSLRTKVNPLGRQGLDFVHRANGMISRWGYRYSSELC